MKRLIQDIKKDPSTYIMLFIMVGVVAFAIYRFIIGAVASDGFWRELYCQNYPLQCIRKGW